MPQTRFLNVDLDVASESDMGGLLTELEAFAYVVNPGPQPFATLELNEQPSTPAQAIAVFHKAFGALSPEARAIWNGLLKRELNIGFQAGDLPYSSEYALSRDTLSMAADMNASIVVTIYGSSETGSGAGRR